MGGRGSSSGMRGKGFLRVRNGASRSEQLDVSALAGYPVNRKGEFETFLNMKDNKVEYAYLIDKNGTVVAGAKGGRHSVGVAYNESQEGMTLTHNHPSTYGGTFSEADISHLTNANLGQMRAVAKEGTYKMVATKKANPKGLNQALARDSKRIREQGAKNMAKVKQGTMNKRQYSSARRKAYVDTIHSWYQKNASKYGYNYTFTPNKDYNI